MAESQFHVSARQPDICPECGSSRVVPIVYGYPTDETFKKADEGRVALGGCVVSPSNPRWQCLDCETAIHEK